MLEFSDYGPQTEIGRLKWLKSQQYIQNDVAVIFCVLGYLSSPRAYGGIGRAIKILYTNRNSAG